MILHSGTILFLVHVRVLYDACTYNTDVILLKDNHHLQEQLIYTTVRDSSQQLLLTKQFHCVCLHDAAWLHSVIPPGFAFVNNSTVRCNNGQYRSRWQQHTNATSCQTCGQGISSDLNFTTLTTYDANGVISYTLSSGSSEACCEH